MLEGNIPVIPTPFLNGNVEYAGFDRLFERTSEHLQGYIVCGSTGEAPALTTTERQDIIRYTAKQLPDSRKAVVGLGHTCLEDIVAIGSTAVEAGVQYGLIPSPYYFPNSLDMVIDFVGEIGRKTELDLIFYDNPVTTDTRFTAEQLVRLAEAVPQIKGIKMTDHSFSKMRHLKKHTNLAVFGGDDIICFRSFEAGVDGSMIITPSVLPATFEKCWDAYKAGDREKSFRIFSHSLLPFIHMFGPGDEIPTTKALFKQLGIFASDETRTPLLPANQQRVKEMLLGYQQASEGEAGHALL